jgi:proton glutamate symport protein
VKKLKLHWQILIAIGLAILFSVIFKAIGLEHKASARLILTCNFMGTLFMNALKMIVVPLIVPSIICGMIGLGNERNIGRLGAKIFSYYAVSGILAILTGLILVNVIQPGNVDPATAQAILSHAEDPAEFMKKVEGRSTNDVAQIFIRMIPTNVFHAATDNSQLLGLIFFALLFGAFAGQLPEHHRKAQQSFWESFLAVMMKVTDFIIRFSPFGVFGLITPIILETGTGAILPLAKFFITVLLALGIHAFVTLPLLLLLFKLSPRKHFQATSPALLMAFSTASSASTLPVTMEAVEKRAGVSPRISSFALPLGATVNMDGTALYECVVVIFIAQFYAVTQGIELAFSTQFTVVLLALLTSVGVAGIPSASLVAIALILGAVGLPVEAVGIVLVVDRILDMCRTSVNVFSDTCGAVIIARSEGETDLYKDADARLI